jgi:hypothetical protein
MLFANGPGSCGAKAKRLRHVAKIQELYQPRLASSTYALRRSLESPDALKPPV